ncbi:hypothetical protein HMPREF3206_00082 [Fusobacterium equinum]|uniref:Uncharacterized protein n=1 Tax=Fusobacterium equinum TaxID=134605 RepID=A0A133NKV5_9FUSO|nr:hypothetical protein HMPREF3206_00082 [Fusobacterium equinum]
MIKLMNIFNINLEYVKNGNIQIKPKIGGYKMEKKWEEKMEKQMKKALKKMPWEIKKIHILLTFWKWWKGR